MSIDNALEAVRKKAVDVSKRIYEKRCSLASTSGGDGYTKDLMEFSHLEGLLEGFEVAISEVEKHLDTETNLPTSAKRSVGEDINVPTTPPAWIKRGQWVMGRDGQLWKIVGFAHGLLQAVLPNKAAALIGPWQELKPVKFRPYTYEEANGLLGRHIHVEYPRGIVVDRIITCIQKYSTGDIGISDWDQNILLESNATIDGMPIGVPEVDEEAMKGGEE